MRLSDTPTVEVVEQLACSPEQAWALVNGIELPTRADGELQRVEWLDGATGVGVGARFRGYNGGRDRRAPDVGVARRDGGEPGDARGARRLPRLTV